MELSKSFNIDENELRSDGFGFYNYKGIKYTGKTFVLRDKDEKYEKSNLKRESEWVNGKEISEKKWYENGRLESESNDGCFRSWYENGQLECKQYIKNSEPHGTTKSWDESGKLIEERFYNNGIKIDNQLNSSRKLKIDKTFKFDNDYVNINKFVLPKNQLIKVSSGFSNSQDISEFIFPNVKEIYFSYEMIFHNGVYQRKKSESNINSDVKSKFLEEYELDGHHDDYDDFDESNEVFKGNFSQFFSYKISSNEFSDKFNIKIKEFLKENYDEDGLIFKNFFEWLNENWILPISPTDSVELLLQSLDVKKDNIEVVFDDVLIDDDGYQISWCQYSFLNEEIFNIKLS